MKPEKIEELEGKKNYLILKSQVVKYIREFFEINNFIEVFTPILIDAPAPEEYIEAFDTSTNQYLRTSPELEMKQMLSAGYEKIFQMGQSFREGEKGNLHSPEFLMLEWYEVGADYNDLIDFTSKMLSFIDNKLSEKNMNNSTISFNSKNLITVHDAFAKFANITPEETITNNNFEEVLLDEIEPNLGFEYPLFLIDYPAKLAAFSRLKEDNPTVCERWELYLNGIEIANAYSELVNPKLQREQFAKFAKTRKETNFKEYPNPKDFLDAIDYGIPNSGGCALGVDRLAIIFANVKNINKVLF